MLIEVYGISLYFIKILNFKKFQFYKSKIQYCSIWFAHFLLFIVNVLFKYFLLKILLFISDVLKYVFAKSLLQLELIRGYCSHKLKCFHMLNCFT